MLKALKDYRVWVIGVCMGVIGASLPFIIVAITLIPSLNATPFYGYPYLLGAIMVIFFLVGYIWGSTKEASYRRKTKRWDDKLEPEIKTSFWKRRLPFYIAGIICLIPFIVIDIMYMVNGVFPLL